MRVECPNCGADIEEPRLDHRRGRAQCERCSAIFNLPDEVDAEANDWATPAFEEMGAEEDRGDDDEREWSSSIPKRIGVEEGGGRLTIVHDWPPERAYLTLVSVPFIGYVWFWVFRDAPGGIPTLFKVGSVVLVAYFYWACARIANSTEVSVSEGRLSIDHRPVPWWGNHTLTTGEIGQLYCKSRDDWWATLRQRHRLRPKTVYDVMARLADGREIRLVPGLHGQNQALYIEYAVETHLGIEDRPVAGELPG